MNRHKYKADFDRVKTDRIVMVAIVLIVVSLTIIFG